MPWPHALYPPPRRPYRPPRSNKLAGSEIERKIAEATSNKPWGASTTMMQEIAQLTFD